LSRFLELLLQKVGQKQNCGKYRSLVLFWQAGN